MKEKTLKEEVSRAINEASGEDKIIVVILNETGNETIEDHTELFIKCTNLCDEIICLNFTFPGESQCHHSMDCCFDSCVT